MAYKFILGLLVLLFGACQAETDVSSLGAAGAAALYAEIKGCGDECPERECVPHCTRCGAPDGCGEICQTNSCGTGSVCADGRCCAPSCTGKACGEPDGCGGRCDQGLCPAQQQCRAGACVCAPDCAGKACDASDGCGGLCNLTPECSCAAGQVQCVSFVGTGTVQTITVPATTQRLTTNISLRDGSRYRFSASGTIRVGALFEGDTQPWGWDTHGVAGSGFPASDVYKYALLVEDPATGAWLAVDRSIRGKTGKRLTFGINDTNWADNTGQFTVEVREEITTYVCRSGSSCSVSQGPVNIWRAQTGKTKTPAAPAAKPCEGITPDGQRLELLFQSMCANSGFVNNTPGTGCTREEARTEARAYLAGTTCYLTELDGEPLDIDPPDAGPQ